ncbi:DUF2802 domain-containing protein [Parasulfuritortus cantonensis]|uniref:DUF2802 domain-containing protein n=1 Tax=Parasulfuritortus cantonensis TaxID=2528202 RepID=A0A4R1BL31_9PROT|nr:DUF2802 domain-containing protein [Parasulfuritortus cantonensis]TCJ17958.1 DUF2802 domain-containing protein [Parasulfuritortus cantonensis]
MMELTITWREFLLAVCFAGAAYLLVGLARQRVARGRRDTELAELRSELAALRQRLEALENTVDAAPGGAAAAAGTEAYDYAVQYARQGMIAPEIAARCGISRDEATLIVAMHGKGREIAPPG